ncbi:Uncharacterized membrane protein YheB, UPF0754 family [Desulfuromusa kysingii]|uniref:Uncharacterized membrane protein YheB, UPF0754 family n=1 Tax=Desulfuromusa kysingii TaxID=37625 RepID=A0A1H4AP33_9BACT|nr:DUF445 family protein [Desulfuromusa kysingii]SEA37568.1 Uncharacterized membrane protein YheB, UPF0754 family [Desulfuromusa kysingii]
MEYQQYLPYVIPPLLGALIGYVTNYIAIRMLFRPLRAWRILGVRLPLTPGIIPAKRGELAVKMGEMVGAHLLTADDVGRAFAKDSIQRELRLTVTEKLGSFLDRELGTVESLIPKHFRPRFREITSLIQVKLAKLIFEYFQSEQFEQTLREYLQEQSNQFLARDLASFLTPEHYQAAQNHVSAKYSAFFRSPKTASMVGGYVDRKTGQLLATDLPLRKLLPDDLVELVLAQLEKELPPLAEKFGGMLYDPTFRARLVNKGKLAIDSFLDSLGGLAGLLSGFMDLNKIYDKIPEFLDKAGDEIADWLKEERTQQQLAKLLRERADGLLDRSLASYVEKMPYEKIEGVRQFIKDQVVGTVQSNKTVDTAIILTESAVDRLKDKPFSELLNQVLPENGLDFSRERIADKLLELIRSPQARETLERVLVEQSNHWLYQQPLGLLSARLPGDLRLELEAGICQLVEEMLKKEAPRLVDTLNIRRMVEEKVNSLDLLQVEDLLMGVMKEQFKYINLFGALLGFLIGFVNILAFQLM